MMGVGSVAEWALVAAPLGALFVAAFAHVVLSRIRRGTQPVPLLLAAATVGAIAMLATSLSCLYSAHQTGFSLSWPDALGRLLVNCVAYNAGFYLYASLFIGLYSSLRIAALREIAAAERPLTEIEIASLTDRSQLAADRLQRLVADGRLVCRDSRYFCRPDWLLAVSRAYSLWRRVLFGVPYLSDAPLESTGSKSDHRPRRR